MTDLVKKEPVWILVDKLDARLETKLRSLDYTRITSAASCDRTGMYILALKRNKNDTVGLLRFKDNIRPEELIAFAKQFRRRNLLREQRRQDFINVYRAHK